MLPEQRAASEVAGLIDLLAVHDKLETCTYKQLFAKYEHSRLTPICNNLLVVNEEVDADQSMLRKDAYLYILHIRLHGQTVRSTSAYTLKGLSEGLSHNTVWFRLCLQMSQRCPVWGGWGSDGADAIRVMLHVVRLKDNKMACLLNSFDADAPAILPHSNGAAGHLLGDNYIADFTVHVVRVMATLNDGRAAFIYEDEEGYAFDIAQLLHTNVMAWYSLAFAFARLIVIAVGLGRP
eukprot:jgi/Chlat1/6431/Chrsp45S05951